MRVSVDSCELLKRQNFGGAFPSSARADRRTLPWGQSPPSPQQLQVGSPLEHCLPFQPGSSHPAEYQTLHLQMAAHRHTGLLAAQLVAWGVGPDFLLWWLLLLCAVTPNLLTSLSAPSFPLRSRSGGGPCLPGAKLLTASVFVPAHTQAALALASSPVCRQPPSADPIKEPSREG